MFVKYQKIKKYSRSHIIKIINSDNQEQISNMLLGIAYCEEDLNYAFNLIKKYCYSDINNLIGVSILCISHLCRVHGRLPFKETEKIYSDIINSELIKNNHIYSRVCDSLSDIYIFCPKLFAKLKQSHPEFFNKIEI